MAADSLGKDEAFKHKRNVLNELEKDQSGSLPNVVKKAPVPTDASAQPHNEHMKDQAVVPTDASAQPHNELFSDPAVLKIINQWLQNINF